MARHLLRGLGWVAGRIPTLLVWAALAGLFAYGAGHGWKFGGPAEKEKEKGAGERPDTTGPGAFTPYYQERAFDVPVQVTHDPKTCRVGEKPIKFGSAGAAELAGIRTTGAERRPVTITVTAHGEVQQDPFTTAKVSPRVGGVLAALEKQIGDPVRAGELLALVESVDVGKAKAAYLTAKALLESREQERSLLSPEVSPPASIVKADSAVREARAALYSARQAIANLGLPVPTAEEEKLPDEPLTRRLLLLGVPFGKRLELYARWNATGHAPGANLLPVVSPLRGVVVRRAGVVGETVAALQQIYEVGDPTRVYVYLDVRQEDMGRVAVGQALTFRIEGGANLPTVGGTTDWINPAVDEKTRTVRVRGKVANPGGALKAGAFGEGKLTVDGPRPALMVPREAVHWEGCSNIVFVKKTEAGEVEYWPRKVALGVRDNGAVEVTSGLAEGEEVAVGGSHVLKNELLKARIGEAEE